MGAEIEKEKTKFVWIVFSIGVCTNTAVLTAALVYGPGIGRESGMLENVQAFQLALGGLLFGAAALRAETIGERRVYLGLAVFFVSFFTREIEVGRLSQYWVVFTLLTAPAKYIWLTAVWGAMAVLVLVRLRPTWHFFLTWLRCRSGKMMIFAGLLYCSGLVFDKNLFGLSRMTRNFFEECLEVNATTFMLFAAILSLYQIGQAVAAPPVHASPVQAPAEKDPAVPTLGRFDKGTGLRRTT